MTILIIVVAATVLISAMCSLFEATLYSTRVGLLEAEAAGGRHARAARRMLDLKRRIAQPTAAILVLNTIANTAGAAVAGMVATDVLGPQLIVAFSIGLTVLILFIGEILPKTYGATAWRSAWPFVVWPLSFLRRALAPAIWLTQKVSDLIAGDQGSTNVTEDEIQAVIRMGGSEGELSPSELQLLTAVFHFDETVVRQVMLPRREVVYFDIGQTLPECLEIVRRTRHTRYPICHGSLDSISGLVHIKDLLGVQASEDFDLEEIARPLRTVPDTLGISKLLRQMQSARQHMVAVVDEYGTVVGIVTMENIFEQLVGAVRDEFDEEAPDIVPEQEGVYKVRGHLQLDRLNRELGLDLSSEEVDTISGLVAERIGRLPRAGDEIVVDGLTIEIVETQAGRATWVRLITPDEAEHAHHDED
ncbi:MAG: DUF21 domain-containing protein [Acidobacteria bacterium]|nr:DUF21 domain-containing protein [Acidobacteriota bacterium]